MWRLKSSRFSFWFVFEAHSGGFLSGYSVSCLVNVFPALLFVIFAMNVSQHEPRVAYWHRR